MRIMILLVLIGVASTTEITLPSIPAYLVDHYGVYLEGGDDLSVVRYECVTFPPDLQIMADAITYGGIRYEADTVSVTYSTGENGALMQIVVVDNERVRWVIMPDVMSRIYFRMSRKVDQSIIFTGEGANVFALFGIKNSDASGEQLRSFVDGRAKWWGVEKPTE